MAEDNAKKSRQELVDACRQSGQGIRYSVRVRHDEEVAVLLPALDASFTEHHIERGREEAFTALDEYGHPAKLERLVTVPDDTLARIQNALALRDQIRHLQSQLAAELRRVWQELSLQE